MISIPSSATIFLAVESLDFRKQLDATAKYIKSYLNKNPKSRAYFFFMSKNRRMIRILTHDGTGFCMITKKLDVGQFKELNLLRNVEKKLVRVTRENVSEVAKSRESKMQRKEIERAWKEGGCFPLG